MKFRYLLIPVIALGLLNTACRTVEESSAHETRWGIPEATVPDDQPTTVPPTQEQAPSDPAPLLPPAQ